MSLYRKGTWLAALVLVLVAGLSASAQGLRDADPFAPAEPSHYGGGVRANEGFFFTYDALYWWASPPQRSTFGIDTSTLAVQRQAWWVNDPNETFTQGSTMNTDFLQDQAAPGQRIEFGNVYEHTGWLFSYFELHDRGQSLLAPGVQAYFNDQNWGVNNLPHLASDVGAGNIEPRGVWYDSVTLSNDNRIWGTEFNFLYRTHPGDRGGMWEWYLGLRYIDFIEEFDINGLGTPPTSVLADTTVDTYATNQLFGPQVGLRWFITNDRWQFSATGKFMAAWNSQNVKQTGVVASELGATIFPRPATWPLAMTPTNVDYREHMDVFSPVVELRLEGKYQITDRVAFTAGWNGMFIDDLARPSRMVNYELAQTHVMGILSDKNRDRLFLQGLSIGIEINR